MSETNKVKVALNGKRRQELGLVVPGKYCARTAKPTQDNHRKVY